MSYEKRHFKADSLADDARVSCRDVVMGVPADEENSDDRSDRRRRKVQLAIAGASLILLLGSAGYFALSPDVISMCGGTPAAQGGSNADGEGRGAEPVEGALVASDSVSAEGSHGQSFGSSGGDESKSQSGASDSDGSSASSSNGSSANSDGSSSQNGSGSQSDKPASGAQKPAPKTISVSISVDSSSVGGPVSASGTFNFEEGATVYDALCALGLSIRSQDSVYGVYVSSINGLAEKEHGASSGWMYAVNGSLPNMACSAYKLSDGDSIQWRYVTGQ